MADLHITPTVRPTVSAIGFEALLLFAMVIRIAAHFALPQPLQSDGLAYFTLAQTMADGQWPTDNFGQHAFYSIGYPLVLAPFFAVFGATQGIAFAVNLLLAACSGALIWLTAREAGLSPMGRKLALLAYGVWLPGIWNATMLARENLSCPLLLLVMFWALRLLNRGPKPALALGAGASWGAALLAGTSALPLVAAPVLAIAIGARWRVRAMVVPGLTLFAAAALVLAPWGWATQRMLGAATLTTNSGFNLYIGNNPAATGRFISIAATPIGPQWHALRAARGEMGAGRDLGHMATAWMVANPGRVAQLAAVKLGAFWWPNLPDSNDFALSRAVTLIRIGEVFQYLLFITLALVGFIGGALVGRTRAIIGVAIGGFWMLHGAAYIIERYRDPVMPLMMIVAAAVLADAIANHITKRETVHAA